MKLDNKSFYALYQVQFLSKVIKDKAYSYIDDNNITADYFIESLADENDKPDGTTLKDVFNFIISHYKKEKEIPGILTIQSHYPNFDVFDCNDSIEFYIKNLRNEKKISDFCETVNNLADLIKNGADYNQLSIYAQEHFKEQKDDSYANMGTDMFEEGLDQRVANYLDGLTNNKNQIMPLGFPELDKEIGGIRKDGELVLIQGKLGIGKTSSLVKIICEALLRDESVCVYTPELSKDELGKRIDSYFSHISSYKLTHYLPIEQNYLDYKMNVKGKYKLKCLDALDFNGNKPTVSQFKGFCKYHNITLLVIDGLDIKYIDDLRASKNDTAYVKLGNISNDLLTASKELRMPVIASVQAQRGDKDMRLSNDTISGSMEIPRVATMTISLERKDEDSSTIFNIHVDKNRHGKDGITLNYYVDLDKNVWSYNKPNTDTQQDLTPHNLRRTTE